jgi:ABC-type dipeptide/oligopeptide/nickel transport system permease subunit
VIAVAIAVLGPFFAPHNIAQPIGAPWSAPGSGAPLGTDFLGRDVLSRVLSGGRTVVLLPLVATAISVTLGAVIGVLAGSIHNWIDGLLMRSMDLILAMPAILILLVLVTGFGGGPGVLVAVVVLITGPFTARLARSLAIDVSRTGYVESAIGQGEGMTAVLFREIMPNVGGPLLAEAGLVYTSAIFVVAFASYLGFGVQPPTADWALMAAENDPGIDFNVWSVLVPVLLIVSLTISANLLADRLAQRLARDDPRTAVR